MTRDEMFDWLRRKAAVVQQFPVPAGNPVTHALALQQRGDLVMQGHPEFHPAEAVVFGVKGGVHPGILSFGGEFEFEADCWVATSHREHNKRTTIVIGALRRRAIEALFEARIFIDPAAERTRKEAAAAEARLGLLEAYGLSYEAYGIARTLVEDAVTRGRFPRERMHAEIGNRLHYVAGLMRAADTWSWADHLRPDNATSRAVFERLTGAHLPPTLRGSQVSLSTERDVLSGFSDHGI